MQIAFYGSSLLSAYWNGAATYYRGLLKALASYGHTITFFEPDAFERQSHRDIDPPEWAHVVVYPATRAGVADVVAQAAQADVAIKASGVGVFDAELLTGMLAAARPGALRIFWDVDAPATLAEMRAAPDHVLRRHLPHLDLVLTYGGGPPVVAAYGDLGARECVPIYNGLDPATHFPVVPQPAFAADLSFLANRLPDREARVQAFFLHAAEVLPQKRFLLGGSGWADKPMGENVLRIGHVPTRDHNALNCSALAVLNVARDSMAQVGFSPATRVFEAAGAGACLITDAWEGIEMFLAPDSEVLVARDGADVAEHLRALTPARARAIGQAARQRCLAEHSYGRRAAQVHELLMNRMQQSRNTESRMSEAPLRIVVIGLSLSSSWGNGHATTYRALLRALAARGHEILFLECDRPWYAAHRDLPDPDFCRLALYDRVEDLAAFRAEIAAADFVIIGSYVVDGIEVATLVRPWARKLAFYDIDTPVTLASLARGDAAYISADTIPLYDVYLSFTGGPTLQVLERRYGARMARALYCAVDPALYRPADTHTEPRWHLGYLGTYSEDRQPVLDRLLLEPARRAPGLRFVVAGPQYPASIAWPSNVDRIEHLPPDQHAEFYTSLAWTLNVTRADMVAAGYSPSVRLFEAAACATPIISDAWEGLGSIFEIGTEILCAGSAEDVLAALHWPAARYRALGEAARGCVLRHHTADHRAAALIALINEDLVSPVGIEPTTPRLKVSCSTD